MNSQNSKKEDVIIVGFGASSLNVRALISSRKNHNVRFHFFDSLDPNKIEKIQEDLDIQKAKTYIISKSGSTNETNILAEYLISKNARNLNILCANRNSNLGKLVQDIDHNWIDLDKDISGRFSLLTKPFLDIAELAGVDSAKILEGAKSVKERAVEDMAKYFLDNYDQAKPNYVIMLYADQLTGLYNWVRQIIAESTGKNDFGFNPILSECSMDEHSQLQLYLDGPDDKFFHIVSCDYQSSNLPKNIGDLQIKHSEKAVKLLESKQKNVKHYHHEKLDEFLVGYIIQMFMETMKKIAENVGFDPFNQPSVEQLKERSNEN